MPYSDSDACDKETVGARNNNGNGSAYLFEKPEAGWIDMTETVKFTASDGAMWDHFGCSVSISGDTVVAGAYGDDDDGDGSGSAYLFEKPGSGWTDMTETAKLSASDGAEGDSFGYSVSISGATVVVGAHGDDQSRDCIGSAYLFTKPGAGWADMTETAKFTPSDGSEQDYFGWSAAINGDTAVVGARLDDDNGENSGSAYVFLHFKPVAWLYLPVVLHSAP